jgi:hypothetical protein
MSIAREFEKLFTILSNEKFLRMEGLGNEVPFFIHAYDIIRQEEVYRSIHQVRKRLSIEKGVQTELISLYDMVLEIIQETNELEDVFELEKEVSKQELIGHFNSIINPEEIKSFFTKKLAEGEFDIMMVYQVGEVYPYLRTHDILNQLQSIVKDMPLVVFFPGDYVMSKEIGFNLNLFGRFRRPYYRAFRLDDYLVRGNIHG